MRVVVHVNPNSNWQPKYAAAILSGLQFRGHEARISHQKQDRDDLVVLLGPHWAKQFHNSERCIYVDRAFWGDPQSVSVHWMESGEKIYDWTPKPGRWYPSPSPMKRGSRKVVLCDYQKVFDHDADTIRLHPTEQRQTESIQECLNRHDIAIGGRSTAMVEAALMGLMVVTCEQNTPVDPISDQSNPDRESWLKALSWHNWTFDEIKTGEIWDHFTLK